MKDELSNARFFHSEKFYSEYYANNGKITIECMVDYENVNEYLDAIVLAIKNIISIGIGENEFEIEKNAFIINFLKENEKVKDLAISAAREVAVSKQSFSLASELMKVELTTFADANEILRYVFDFNKLYIAYLGNQATISADKYLY